MRGRTIVALIATVSCIALILCAGATTGPKAFNLKRLRLCPRADGVRAMRGGGAFRYRRSRSLL